MALLEPATELDQVKVLKATPPPAPEPTTLITDSPSFEPAPPAGGARSAEEVFAWSAKPRGQWEQTSQLDGFRLEAGRVSRSADAGARRSRSLRDVFAQAEALISQGLTEDAREGLVLLTGNFPGNDVREEAWNALLRLDAETALGTRQPRVIVPIALSMDAFLESYSGSRHAESIRDRQVRVWAHLAKIEPETYCGAALERAAAWEASLGNWVPFETRMVVARMRDGPCSK